MAAFDDPELDYEAQIERAIAFAGQPHEVYLAEKARRLPALAERH